MSSKAKIWAGDVEQGVPVDDEGEPINTERFTGREWVELLDAQIEEIDDHCSPYAGHDRDWEILKENMQNALFYLGRKVKK